ncbi:MAG: DEAD/DEAH box helicase [Deltaproteobacteria bacterium]|nr:DEAD/DEAH box helicase [Deltaproteobacteria bacterium]
MKSFQELNLHPTLAQAIQAMRFTIPTPIQARAIPVALARRDLIGCAQTGTGKTVAFCIPLLTHLLKANDKTGLVLVPTRELAQQVAGVLKSLSRFCPQVKSAVLIGGVAMQPQISALRQQPKILIATPGRLLDHLNRGTVSLSRTDILVLDEADRMLDMGFAPQLRQLLRYLPKVRQTLLFSATWSSSMDRLSAQHLRDPIRITIGPISQAASQIEQTMVATTTKLKNDALLDELIQTQGSVLVFARTQHRTDRVAKYLNSYGLEVNRIHGGRTQGQRTSALKNFRDGKTRILIATDIAARGIDITHISHVINYDLPQSPEDYIHRIGRTARAGATGEAISLVTPEENGQWRLILRLLKQSGSPAPQSRQSIAQVDC